MSVFDLTRDQFLDKLGALTTPQEVFENAHDIYGYLSDLFEEDFCDMLREWSFQWYCEQTGDSYKNIYNRWLRIR
jgi:hypothetical protein